MFRCRSAQELKVENPTVLYVEDDEMSREVMQFLLTLGLGMTKVTLFDDSTDFIKKVEALPEKPDVIFLDIHMMPIDGFSMLKLLREHEAYKNTIVVALTASVMNEEVQLLQSAGFNSCIPKPIDQRTFPATLNRILSGERIWRIK
jgi:CheY-like chemotaxis protein